jgi:hypothetical protein
MPGKTHVPSLDRLLGPLGLVLIVAVSWLADRGFAESPTRRGRLTAFVARRAIDGIAVIGRVVDRLPLPASRPAPPEACRV